MSYTAIDQNGNTVWSPSAKQRRNLLGSLNAGDTESCVALVLDGQWVITAYHSGLVCLENGGTGEGPWHMTDLTVPEILKLWQLLTENSIDELRQFPWEDGDGL